MLKENYWVRYRNTPRFSLLSTLCLSSNTTTNNNNNKNTFYLYLYLSGLTNNENRKLRKTILMNKPSIVKPNTKVTL